jgi:hypothetical protein
MYLYQGAELLHVLPLQSEITGLAKLGSEVAVSCLTDPSIKLYSVGLELRLVKTVLVGSDIADIAGLESCLVVSCISQTAAVYRDGTVTYDSSSVTSLVVVSPDTVSCLAAGQSALLKVSSGLDVTVVHSPVQVLALVKSAQALGSASEATVLGSCSSFLYLSALVPTSCYSDSHLDRISAYYVNDLTTLTARGATISKAEAGHTTVLSLPEAFSVSLLSLTESGLVIAYCHANSQSFLVSLFIDCASTRPVSQLPVEDSAKQLRTSGSRVFVQFHDCVRVYSSSLETDLAVVSTVWEGFEAIRACVRPEEAQAVAEAGLMRSRAEVVDFALTQEGLAQSEVARNWILVILTPTSLVVLRCSAHHQNLLAKIALDPSEAPCSLAVVGALLHVRTSRSRVLTFLLEWRYEESRLKKPVFTDLRTYSLTPVSFTSAECEVMGTWGRTLYVVDSQRTLLAL